VILDGLTPISAPSDDLFVQAPISHAP
jgi:hypothetical protein